MRIIHIAISAGGDVLACVLRKGCPSAADAPEGQELLFGGDYWRNKGAGIHQEAAPTPTAIQGTGRLSSILGASF